MMRYSVTTMAQDPHYGEAISELRSRAWPAFIDYAEDYHWEELFRRFAEFQFLFVSNGDLLGICHTLPLFWSGESHCLPDTIEAVIIDAIGCLEINKPANTLAALAIIVSDRCDKLGLTSEILSTVKNLVSENNLQALIVPVRPALKSEYPLIPFEQYIHWKRKDGGAFDPLLRLHWEMGASMLGIASQAITVEGSVEKWKNWTTMDFSESGEYIVDGAQRPVIIDHATNCGTYSDPSLWMLHR